MEMIKEGSYIPKRLLPFFDKTELTIDQKKALESFYFGRLVQVASKDGTYVSFLVDFRRSQEELLKQVEALKLQILDETRLKQSVRHERNGFDLVLFEKLNGFHEFVDWVWGIAQKDFKEFKLVLKNLDMIGRTFVIYNGYATNEWARLKAPGSRCYYAKAAFLNKLRSLDEDHKYDSYLLVGRSALAE